MSTPLGPWLTARSGPTLREPSGMSERRSRFAPESGASVLHDRCSLGDDFTESHVPGRLQDGVGSGREIVGVQVESRHVDDDALLVGHPRPGSGMPGVGAELERGRAAQHHVRAVVLGQALAGGIYQETGLPQVVDERDAQGIGVRVEIGCQPGDGAVGVGEGTARGDLAGVADVEEAQG